MESVNNHLVWRFNALSGQRIFIPGDVANQSCGFMEDALYESDPEDSLSEDPSVDLEDEALRLQLAHDQYEEQRKKDIDSTFVGEDICMFYPTTEAPQNKYPVVTMRQQAKRLSKKDFSARERMFDIAYQTNALFTISVKPIDPTVFQLWYQRRYITGSRPNEVYNRPASKTTENPQTEDSQPVKQMGFLKPFETFSSAEYGADPTFDRIEGEAIDSAEDIQSVVADIEDPNLKENMSRILAEFLEDKEAESVALMGHDKGKPLILLFHKV